MKLLKQTSIFLIFILSSFSLYSIIPQPMKQRIILIGAGGKKAKEYYALLKNQVHFVGFIQPSPRPDIISLSHSENIPLYNDLKTLNKEVIFDGAIIAVPHHLHFNYTKELLSQGKFVIKEKPISLTQAEALEYRSINLNPTPQLFTIVQRQFQSSFTEAKKDLKSIGKIYTFKYEYCLCLADRTSGWRTQRALSGGGVLIDAGYHVIDILNSFFGTPLTVNAQFAYSSPMKQEALEDTAIVLASYSQDIAGVAIISRYGPQKKECFEILGEQGTLRITPTEYVIYDEKGNIAKTYRSLFTKEEETANMFLFYIDHIQDLTYIENELKRHELNIELIEKAYKPQIKQPALMQCVELQSFLMS